LGERLKPLARYEFARRTMNSGRTPTGPHIERFLGAPHSKVREKIRWILGPNTKRYEKYLVSTSIKVINGGEQTLKKVVVGCEENSHGWIKHKDIPKIAS
jgi:hypothetical protein